ncbi:hypothetical protein AMS68_004635 [Peltaster fructicola]|uniref:Uncharacterized protein n=1 Tax=Peltaster fructicola TaxID=286661 RepID=A0A6H0XWZ4_9PEZI|nr:hypothetical protein AMS68_004635 [Peltaster fructicola]
MPSDENDISDNESFKSFDDEAASPALSKEKTNNKDKTAKPATQRYPQEEEHKLLSESNAEKQAGNGLFGKASFENAIQTYDRALSICPNYLDYEIAILRSNIAACHLKLDEWKEAVDSASKGIECLQRLEPLPELPRQTSQQNPASSDAKDNDTIEEVDDDLAARIENLSLSGHTIQEVRALQTKLLLRRARAKTSLNSWADLQAADEDYRTLLLPAMQASLTNSDKRTVLDAQRSLTPRLNEAREKEVAEMMGKLKGLGNSILKPFGLSTENFQFVKDENSGGYSMNFSQNPAK